MFHFGTIAHAGLDGGQKGVAYTAKDYGLRWKGGTGKDLMAATGSPLSGFSVLFSAGARPDLAVLDALLRADADVARAFSISHRPDEAGWVEVLANGLTFDLRGLSPEQGVAAPVLAHAYGFPAIEAVPAGEWIDITVGRHLSGGHNLVPVVRAMASVALALLAVPGVAAVAWRPARTVLSPDYFRRAVGAWLGGGAFPALGMTALVRDPSGAMVSEGLTFFTGQELRIDPIVARNPATAGKIAIRLIHSLVSGWSVPSAAEIAGPDGERLGVEPTDSGRVLRVWKAH